MSNVAELVGLVQALVPNWDVQDFPDKTSEFQLTHPIGTILIQYGGSRFGPSETLGVVVQQRNMQFGLTVIGYAQHGDEGVVTMINFLCKKLPGQTLPDCDPIRVVRDFFAGEHGGRWEYVLEIEMGMLNVGQEIKEW